MVYMGPYENMKDVSKENEDSVLSMWLVVAVGGSENIHYKSALDFSASKSLFKTRDAALNCAKERGTVHWANVVVEIKLPSIITKYA